MSTSKIKWYKFISFKNSLVLLGGSFLGLVLSAILGFFVPKYITQLSASYSNTELFTQTIYIIGAIFIGTYLNSALYGLISNKFVMDFISHLRGLVYTTWLLSYDISDGEKSTSEIYPQGEVLSRITTDTESIKDLASSGVLTLFIEIFFVGSCLVGFMILNSRSGIIIVGAEVLASVLLLRASRYMRTIFISVAKSRGEVSKTIANLIGGISEVYYSRNESYASKKGKITFDKFLKEQASLNFWDASYFAVAESLYPLLLALMVFIAPYSQITEAAIIFALVDLIQRSITPIKNIASKVANVQRAVASYLRITEFIDDLQNSFSSDIDRAKDKVLDFKYAQVNVESFKYQNKRDGSNFELKDISFRGMRGELVGIVGLSGCGKSTLLNIIAGNIIPDVGDITLQPVAGPQVVYSKSNSLDIASYRDQVGIVSQESHIFSETLRFNITMDHRESQSFDEFWDYVLRKIPYIKTWGLSPLTVLRPKELSLGQKQLLSALRSCFQQRPVVLFDEISSALDSQLEKALRDVVAMIQKYSLTIVVSHRIETIINADKILVMSDGKIISNGKHGDLINSSQVYRDFLKEMSKKGSK